MTANYSTYKRKFVPWNLKRQRKCVLCSIVSLRKAECQQMILNRVTVEVCSSLPL